jgi:hypothetical protein
MRIVDLVIVTDKLAEVRDFYLKHYPIWHSTEDNPNTFSVMPYAQSRLTFLDSASANAEPTRGLVVRITMNMIPLERSRLVAAGVECSDVAVEHWDTHYGDKVQYFSFTDPTGLKVQIFEDRYGQLKQLMTTGDGTNTREVHKKQEQPGH